MIIKGFRGQYSFLSNFYEAPIRYKGITYRNNEAAFQAQKCLERSMEFSVLSGTEAKRLGRQVSLRNDWENVKDQIMLAICREKFKQNSDLQKQLIVLKDAILIEENNWNDTYWGVCKNKGQNKLGEILM